MLGYTGSCMHNERNGIPTYLASMTLCGGHTLLSWSTLWVKGVYTSFSFNFKLDKTLQYKIASHNAIPREPEPCMLFGFGAATKMSAATKIKCQLSFEMSPRTNPQFSGSSFWAVVVPKSIASKMRTIIHKRLRRLSLMYPFRTIIQYETKDERQK